MDQQYGSIHIKKLDGLNIYGSQSQSTFGSNQFKSVRDCWAAA
jgi:hypothetical protein